MLDGGGEFLSPPMMLWSSTPITRCHPQTMRNDPCIYLDWAERFWRCIREDLISPPPSLHQGCFLIAWTNLATKLCNKIRTSLSCCFDHVQTIGTSITSPEQSIGASSTFGSYSLSESKKMWERIKCKIRGKGTVRQMSLILLCTTAQYVKCHHTEGQSYYWKKNKIMMVLYHHHPPPT